MNVMNFFAKILRLIHFTTKITKVTYLKLHNNIDGVYILIKSLL